VTLIVIALHFSPIVAPAPISKRPFNAFELTALERFDPRGMTETELFLAFDKAVSLLVKALDGDPIVLTLRHIEQTFARLGANCFAQ